MQIVQSLLVGASRPFVLCTSECFDSKVAQDLIVGQLAVCNLLAQSNVRALACRNFIVGSRLQLPIRYSTHPFVPELRSSGLSVAVLQTSGQRGCCQPDPWCPGRRHLGSHGGLENLGLCMADPSKNTIFVWKPKHSYHGSFTRLAHAYLPSGILGVWVLGSTDRTPAEPASPPVGPIQLIQRQLCMMFSQLRGVLEFGQLQQVARESDRIAISHLLKPPVSVAEDYPACGRRYGHCCCCRRLPLAEYAVAFSTQVRKPRTIDPERCTGAFQEVSG